MDFSDRRVFFVRRCLKSFQKYVFSGKKTKTRDVKLLI